MLELLKSDTFWLAVGALATVVGVVAIFYAGRQLRFAGWLKAQEIWVSDDFVVARGKLYARLEDLKQPWTPEQKAVGLTACRRIDEFVRLAPYLGKRRMLEVWGDPLAKAWLVLQPLVHEERELTGWSEKWDAFVKVGTKALGARPDLQKLSPQTDA